MTRLVVNRCYGGFSVSKEAASLIRATGCPHGEDDPTWPTLLEAAKGRREDAPRFFGAEHRDAEARTCPALVNAVEALGDRASGEHARLQVIEIPDDAEWYLDEYDGQETIREGRIW